GPQLRRQVAVRVHGEGAEGRLRRESACPRGAGAGAARAPPSGPRRACDQRVERGDMSNSQKDVMIAAYLVEDLAKRDFDAVLKLAEAKTITVEGVGV